MEKAARVDKRVWRAKLDRGSGRTFYKHEETGKKQWKQPDPSTIISAKTDHHALEAQRKLREGTTTKPAKVVAVWKAKIDKKHDRAYYINKITKVRTWVRPEPEEAIIPSSAADFGLTHTGLPAAASGAASSGGDGDGDGTKSPWKTKVDPKSGRTYYVNRLTHERRWTNPEDTIATPAAPTSTHNPADDTTVRSSGNRVRNAGRGRYERVGMRSPSSERARRAAIVERYNGRVRQEGRGKGGGALSLDVATRRSLLCEAAMAMVDLHGGARAFVGMACKSKHAAGGRRCVDAEDLYTGLRVAVEGTAMAISEHDCATLSGSHGGDALGMGQLLRVLSGTFAFDGSSGRGRSERAEAKAEASRSRSPSLSPTLLRAAAASAGRERSSSFSSTSSWMSPPAYTRNAETSPLSLSSGRRRRSPGGGTGGVDHVTFALHSAAGHNTNSLFVYNEKARQRSGVLTGAQRTSLLSEAMADVVEVVGGLPQFFRKYDVNGDRVLSASELRKGMVRNGLKLTTEDAEALVRTFGGSALTMGGLSRILSGARDAAPAALSYGHDHGVADRTTATTTPQRRGIGGVDHVNAFLHNAAGHHASAHETWNETGGSGLMLSAHHRDALLHEAMGDVIETFGGVKSFVHAYGMHSGRELNASELWLGMTKNGLKLSEADAARVVASFGGRTLHMSQLLRLINASVDAEVAAADAAADGASRDNTRDALLIQACAEAVNAAGGPRAFFRACGEGRDGAVVATELVRCFQRFGLAITQDDAVRLVRSGGGRSGVDRLSLNEFTALVVDGSADLLAAATPPSTTTPWRAH